MQEDDGKARGLASLIRIGIEDLVEKSWLKKKADLSYRLSNGRS